MSAPLVARQLCFAYRQQTILQQVDFSIAARQWVLLFGPNGAGKSTLLRLILGLLTPSSGTIEIAGQPPAKMRRAIGYLPQTLHFDPAFPISAGAVILSGAVGHSRLFGRWPPPIRRRADELLEMVGMADKKNARFGTLSGGEMRRVLLARALIDAPQLLLLDEPTANLDRNAEEMLFQILDRIRGHTTLLMVSHALEPVLQRAESALLLYQQRVFPIAPAAICSHHQLGLFHSAPQQG